MCVCVVGGGGVVSASALGYRPFRAAHGDQITARCVLARRVGVDAWACGVRCVFQTKTIGVRSVEDRVASACIGLMERHPCSLWRAMQ